MARTLGFPLLLLAGPCGVFPACGGSLARDGLPALDGGSDDSGMVGQLPDTSTDAAITPRDAMNDGAPRVPLNHRAVGATCPMQRGPGNTDGLPPGDCAADTDCKTGANGRCVATCGPPGCFASNCSYDGCFTDADCGGTVPCACRPSVTSSLPNSCSVGSTCAVDADCGSGGYCSPSSASSRCNVVYHCHTPLDACLDDSDCPPGGCNFHPTLGYWACGNLCPPPPP